MFSIMLVHLCQPPQGPNYLWISGVEGKGQKMQADAKFYFQAQLSSITIISIAARICLKWRVPPATLLGKSLHCLWTLDAIIRTSREVSSVDIQAQSTPVTWVKEVERSPWPHSMTSPLSTQIHTSLPSSFPQAYHESILRCASTHSPGNFDCLTPSPHGTPLSHLKSFSKVSIEPSLQRGFTDH